MPSSHHGGTNTNTEVDQKIAEALKPLCSGACYSGFGFEMAAFRKPYRYCIT